jgi:hypothetical protein
MKSDTQLPSVGQSPTPHTFVSREKASEQDNYRNTGHKHNRPPSASKPDASRSFLPASQNVDESVRHPVQRSSTNHFLFDVHMLLNRLPDLPSPHLDTNCRQAYALRISSVMICHGDSPSSRDSGIQSPICFRREALLRVSGDFPQAQMPYGAEQESRDEDGPYDWAQNRKGCSLQKARSCEEKVCKKGG